MKKHNKGGSIINTASMVAVVGSAAPQLACNPPLGCVDTRYGIEGSSIGIIEGAGDCPRKGWDPSQLALSRTFEYSVAAELFGYTREETPTDDSSSDRPIRYDISVLFLF
jgi:hypothetical protein